MKLKNYVMKYKSKEITFMIKKVFNYIRARLRKIILEEIWLEDYIKRGMKVGENCSIQLRCIFDYSHCHLISIGNNVKLAPEVYILAHDASTKRKLGYTKIGNVIIEDNAFIGARTLIMPGVVIGENSIIGAGSIVTKSVPENSVVAGNPAKFICTYEQYIKSQYKNMSQSEIFEKEFICNNKINIEKNKEMFIRLGNNIGYIR